MTETTHNFESLRAGGAWRIWAPFYRMRERCNGYGFHVALAIVVTTFGLAGYHSTNLFAEGRGVTTWNPTIEWDTAIPPLPWSILIYLSVYLYYPLPFLIADRTLRGRRELALAAQGTILLFLFSYGFFLFMPAEVVVRTQMEDLLPSMHPRFAALYELVYVFDRPWNSWPSLHVSESLLIVLFVQRWLSIRAAEFRRGRLYIRVLWVAWLALSLSIVTTKQHFIWDMFSGAGICALLWWGYVMPRLRLPIAEHAPSGPFPGRESDHARR
ncbi:MAG: hypothetical protein CMJ89_15585 [Planctomycetes bacterium]|nr:hypothetical protein [Planctomycetota bacterium]